MHRVGVADVYDVHILPHCTTILYTAHTTYDYIQVYYDECLYPYAMEHYMLHSSIHHRHEPCCIMNHTTHCNIHSVYCIQYTLRMSIYHHSTHPHTCVHRWVSTGLPFLKTAQRPTIPYVFLHCRRVVQHHLCCLLRTHGCEHRVQHKHHSMQKVLRNKCICFTREVEQGRSG